MRPTAVYSLVVLFLSLLTACTPAAAPVPLAIPTNTLAPAPPTATPSPLPPTSTVPSDLVSPLELVQTRTPAALSINESELATLARADLAEREEIDAARIQVIAEEARTWTNSNLNCGATRSAATPAGRSAEIEGYRLLLAAEGAVYEYHTDTEALVRLCRTGSLYDDYPDLYIEQDAVAAELVRLARQNAAAEAAGETIRLVSVRPATWEDSSLGCPQEGQTYTAAEIGGYRIELQAGDEVYIYHTDFDQIYPCAEEPS